MCIIAAKPAGVELPDENIFYNMWTNNSDGAGIMYVKDGKVRIEKGFMKYTEFTSALSSLKRKMNLKNTPMVFHFRITTHGGTSEENCHPFPVTRSIEMLKRKTCATALGVAHNGIISSVTPRKGISDTMEYIATQLAPLYASMQNFYRDPNLVEMISNAIKSKMAFLNSKGEIYTIGDFVEDKGIMYSNSTYKMRMYYPSYSYWDELDGGWGYGYDKDEGICRDEKLLMWCDLLPDGSYAFDFSSGEMCDDLTEFRMDSCGNVYWYDPDMDACEQIEEIGIYLPDGNTPKFDPELATYEAIVDWDAIAAAYEKEDKKRNEALVVVDDKPKKKKKK